MIESARLGFANAGVHDDIGRAQRIEATAGHFGIWIVRRRDHPRDTCLKQCLRARARSASDIAWLKRHVRCCAASFLTRRFQCDDFGVMAPVILVETFTDNPPAVDRIANNDTAYGWVRTREANPLARQFQRPLHEADVMLVHQLIEKGSSVGFGVKRNHVVDLFACADKANR